MPSALRGRSSARLFLPTEFASAVVIEAKLTKDDVTARDRVMRIVHLAVMRDTRESEGAFL